MMEKFEYLEMPRGWSIKKHALPPAVEVPFPLDGIENFAGQFHFVVSEGLSFDFTISGVLPQSLNADAYSPLQNENSAQFLEMGLSDLVDYSVSEGVEVQPEVSNPLLLVIVVHFHILLFLNEVADPP